MTQLAVVGALSLFALAVYALLRILITPAEADVATLPAIADERSGRIAGLRAGLELAESMGAPPSELVQHIRAVRREAEERAEAVVERLRAERRKRLDDSIPKAVAAFQAIHGTPSRVNVDRAADSHAAELEALRVQIKKGSSQ